MSKGLLIVLSGPSGTGKGTVCDALMEKRADLILSVSCTTRARRGGEIEGVDYFFVSADKFKSMIENGEFLEYASVYSNSYGTPKSFVDEKLSKGENVLLEIDVQGALNVKKLFPGGVYLFLVPPSLTELEHRIRSRGTESELQIETRLGKASDEMNKMSEYDYVIVNDSVEKVVRSIESIIDAEKHRVFRNTDILEKLRNGETI